MLQSWKFERHVVLLRDREHKTKQKAAHLEKLATVTWHPRVPETALGTLKTKPKTNKQTNKLN